MNKSKAMNLNPVRFNYCFHTEPRNCKICDHAITGMYVEMVIPKGKVVGIGHEICLRCAPNETIIREFLDKQKGKSKI